MALKHGIAVAAGPVQLSEIGGVEAGDGKGSAAIVLHDLVRGALCSTADDIGNAGFLLDGECILADGLPPYVLDCARAHTVDALDLVRADDHVLESSALLDLEYGIRVTSLGLASAIDAATESDHSAVELAGDDHRLAQGALASGVGECGSGGGADGKESRSRGGGVAASRGNRLFGIVIGSSWFSCRSSGLSLGLLGLGSLRG